MMVVSVNAQEGLALHSQVVTFIVWFCKLNMLFLLTFEASIHKKLA